ncbi:MAG: hypothetical protein ACYCXQ_08180 [Candidatus Humimicrobiaceae bacterium]
MEDIKSILIKNPDFDKNYIKKWLKEFDNLIRRKSFMNIFDEFLKN